MDLSKSRITITLTLLLAFLAAPAGAYDLDIHSDTYVHFYQQDQVSGSDTDHAPLYEYISLDIWEAGRPEISFHLYGWGRADLRDEADPDATDGYLSSAQVRYLGKGGNSQVRGGRMFITEGTNIETVDGLQIRRSLGRTGFSLYGGKPESGEDSTDSRGDTLAGARVFVLSPGKFEIGLNYLHEDGDFGGEEREEAGTDLWFRPTPSIEIIGHAVYNNTTSGLSSDDISLILTPSSNLEFTLASQGYIYENLFQAVANPAFLSSDINLADEVRITQGAISWNPTGRLDISGSLRNAKHKEADPGDNTRTELRVDLDVPAYLDRVGLRVASQTGDMPENEYNELRAYCMASTRSVRWSIDALALTYEEEISGVDQTTQIVGSAGWKLSDNLDVSGDVRVTKSPVFDEDLAVVLRARYDFGSGSGAD